MVRTRRTGPQRDESAADGRIGCAGSDHDALHKRQHVKPSPPETRSRSGSIMAVCAGQKPKGLNSCGQPSDKAGTDLTGSWDIDHKPRHRPTQVPQQAVISALSAYPVITKIIHHGHASSRQASFVLPTVSKNHVQVADFSGRPGIGNWLHNAAHHQRHSCQ